MPLLSVTPLESDAFSLGAVQRGATHSGVSVGFNLARSPNPRAVLDACFRIADQFGAKLACQTFDDSINPMGQAERKSLANDLSAAMSLFEKAALKPGSAEAIKLFPDS